MDFKPVQKLVVSRLLSTGESVMVGTLAQNRRGVFFSMKQITSHDLTTSRSLL